LKQFASWLDAFDADHSPLNDKRLRVADTATANCNFEDQKTCGYNGLQEEGQSWLSFSNESKSVCFSKHLAGLADSFDDEATDTKKQPGR